MRPLLHALSLIFIFTLAGIHGQITPATLDPGTVGLPYFSGTSSPNPSVKFTSPNTTNQRGVVWSARGLPPGLDLNRQGVLSGKPRREGNYSVSIFVKSGRMLLDNSTVTVAINSTTPPTITHPPAQLGNSVERLLPTGKWDSPYVPEAINNGYKFLAIDGVPFQPNSRYPNGYFWRLIQGRKAAERLPPGMTFNSRGVLSGTPRWSRPPIPSTPQTYKFKVSATDFLGKTAIINCTLVIEPPAGPEILSDCPPEGLEKFRYPSVQLKASGGRTPYKWPRPSGLPPGLVWSERGYISGTPTTRGDFPFELKVLDRNGLSATKNCVITIRPAPELDCPPIPCARVGDTLAPVQLQARGGDLPYTYSAVGLPPSITINSTSGKISGNFSGGGNITYNATFTVRDAVGRTANKTCPIEVKDQLAILTESPLPFGIKGNSYPGKSGTPIVEIEAVGGWPGYSYIRVLGNMPPGLVIDRDSGRILGTPAQIGNYKFTIRVSDSCKTPEKYVDKEFEITIYDPITVLPQPDPCLTVNKAFSLNMTVSGGAEAFVWNDLRSSPAIADASLSVPVLTNTRIARITGTPTTDGLQSFTFNVTSTPLGITETITVNYTIHPELKITSDCPEHSEATVGRSYPPQNFQAVGGTSSGNYTWNATVSVNGTAVHTSNWTAPRTDSTPRFSWTPSVPPGGFTGSGDASGIDHTISMRVTDDCGNTDTKNCTVTVYPALTCNQTLNLPCLYNGTVLPETVVFSASGGKPPYTWTLLPLNNASIILPKGLYQKTSPDSDGSVLYGTFAEIGSFTFLAKVTDGLGNECSQIHTIDVFPPLDILNPTDFFGCAIAGNRTCTDLTAVGGKPPYSWEIVTPLADLAITPKPVNKAEICGTFPNAGNFSLSVKLSDATGCSVIEDFPFEVYSPLQITTECPLKVGEVGQPFIDHLKAVGGKSPYTWQILPQLYVSDFGNHRIRKFYEGGNITTYAGNGTNASIDGNQTHSSFSQPYGMGFDPNGNIYIADFGTSKIRKVSSSGQVTTVGGTTTGYLDGPISIAQFNQPEDMVADEKGNIYVADYGNHRIRKIDSSGNVTTIAGANEGFLDGQGISARFRVQQGICWDLDGDMLLADMGNHAIRKITISGNVTTVAGNGSPGFADGNVQNAKFNGPHDVKVDKEGTIYVVDHTNRKIRKIDMDGNVSTLANVNSPNMLSVDRNGFVYVSDHSLHLIYKITPSGEVSTIAGTGASSPFIDNVPALAATLNSPRSIEINPYEDLPVGLTLNATSGEISGTPEYYGLFNLTYRVTDSCGNTVIGTCALKIDPSNAEPEFDFQLPWQFTDSGALASGHDGSSRDYTSDTLPEGSLWSVSDDNLTSQVTWENSANCVGTNPNTQTATATINVLTTKPQKIGLDWEGIGELEAPSFDMMQVYINNILIGSANAAGGGQGCADGPVVSVENFPNGFDLPAGNHTIFINATTNDGNFHTNSFYRFTFKLIQ